MKHDATVYGNSILLRFRNVGMHGIAPSDGKRAFDRNYVSWREIYYTYKPRGIS